MDLVILPPDVDRDSIAAQLKASHPINVHATGESIGFWANDEQVGASVVAVRRGGWSLAGGEASETRTQLLSQESLLANLRLGKQLFEDAVGIRREFSRRRFGLSWAYPHRVLWGIKVRCIPRSTTGDSPRVCISKRHGRATMVRRSTPLREFPSTLHSLKPT